MLSQWVLRILDMSKKYLFVIFETCNQSYPFGMKERIKSLLTYTINIDAFMP